MTIAAARLSICISGIFVCTQGAMNKHLFSSLLFMRSSSFWVTTFVVVMLHWVALNNLPWNQASAAVTPQTPFFQTRTITPSFLPPQSLAQPAPAVAPTVAPIASPPIEKVMDAEPRPPKPRLTARKKPQRDTTEVLAVEPAGQVPLNDAGLVQLASAMQGNAPSDLPEQVVPFAVSDVLKTDAAQTGETTDPIVVVEAEVASSQTRAAPESVDPSAKADVVRGPGIELVMPSHTSNLASTKPLHAQWPAPKKLLFDVHGQAKKFNYNASAALTWQHDGERYQAEQKISAFLVGQRIQRSVGEMKGDLLAPVRFSDKSRSEKAAHFNHTEHVVTFSSNAPSAPLDVGAQDRLSVFIQLAAWFKAAPDQFAVGTTITLTTVSVNKADRWTFRVEGFETLDLPAGAIPTIKLQRLPKEQYDQKAELWLAPAMDYLPARIRLTQTNGDFADLKLSAYESPP